MRERVNANLIQLNKNTLLGARRQITALLALLVVLGVFWCLKLTGITLAGEAFCGMEEHRHGDNCPTGKLICDLMETPGHVHDECCILRQLICEQEEIPPHVHDDVCRELELVCTEEEHEGHTHDDTCHAMTLVCNTEECEAHAHGEACFTQNLICTIGEEEPEHVHGAECYENVLTCGIEETEGHRHDDACYLMEEVSCGLEEGEGHVHGEACYILHEDSFICGIEETEGHAHTEACYYIGIGFGCGMTEAEGHVHTEECLTEETELGCGQVYTPAHTHTEACYETYDECPLEEHIHVENCYSNINADLETQDDWENSLCNVTREDTTSKTLVAVAQSQIGYTESTLNFEVDLQGVRRGITRYGQWYGNPYGDWSAMFVSFCLYYAGVEDMPANAGTESMRLEWEAAGLYQSAVVSAPQIGNLVFLTNLQGVVENPSAVAVGIITAVSADTITVVEGDVENMVAESTYTIDSPMILGYGMVPEMSQYAVVMASRESAAPIASATDFRTSLLTADYQFVFYTQVGENTYAFDGVGNAVPIYVDSDGVIYSDLEDPSLLLWTCTRNGNNSNNYFIQNVGNGRYLHPFYNNANDNGITSPGRWNTAINASGTGLKFSHSAYIALDIANNRFIMTRTEGENLTFRMGITGACTVWLDGTNGGLSSLGGSQNQSYNITALSQMTLPNQWLSPTKYNYTLRGWYDVTHNQYYAPGEKVTITEDTVFYAEWIAATYDIGQYNAHVANTVSTNSFVTTQIFDYNYLFNVLAADSEVTCSDTSHSENWSIVQNENVNYEDRESLNFIFLDYGSGGTLDYPNNRLDGVNAFPGEGIVTGGIYNSTISNALFSIDDRVPGKYYLGLADHLFQIMEDTGNPYYGYYYYDSARNAASYNQSAGRFYVYDYLEATSAELSAAKSDFLPLNSPYANTNGQIVGTYTADDEHANMTNYVYDAKYSDSENSTDRVSTNYAFGMKMDIRFYLPNKPGEGGNQDLYGNDMRFFFSGDDDLWVLVDGKLALDIGGIHMAENGEINFSTGDVLVQGARKNDLSSVVSALEPGEHTLTVMYLERGASHSNCAIYFNLAPRYRLSIQKEDVLTREFLNGAQFSVFRDFECTIPAVLWENQESYLRGDPATNVFTVTNGVANMWGMGAGNTYYIRETHPPDNADYGFPNGIIRMILDKKGVATYNVMILDGGDGISGGFTVHGFRVDEETQQAYIIATNAPKWVKEVTSVQARKFWEDGLDHSGQTVTVYLTIHDPDGTVRRLQEAQINENTDWQHLWENLPKYYEDGTEIQYGVEEAYVSGYYSKVEKVDTYSVTTTQWAATTSLEKDKTYLLKTGSGFLSTQNRNGDTGYMWVDEGTAKQSDLAQWTVSTESGGYKLTNKAGQTITFYYNGGSPTDFYAYNGGESNASKQYFSYAVFNNQIRLYYDAPNNRDYYLISSMTSAQKFQYSQQAGDALLFTPMTLTQSTISKPVDGKWAYQITNTPLSTETFLTVRKEWWIHTGDDPALYEQAQVTVKLLANGKDTGRTVTLSLKNGWVDVFRGLPYMDNDGNVIQYTVEESWSNKDWLVEYGPINTSTDKIPTYNTTVTNIYRWGHGVELPSTGSPARLLLILCGSGIMLFSLVYGFVSRRKRERRKK